MLERLCDRLKTRGLAIEELSITLGLDSGEKCRRDIRLALPMQDHKIILSLLRLDLQKQVLNSGVNFLSIKVEPVKPRTFQHSLLRPTTPSPDKLVHTLARLRNLVGDDQVGYPQLLNTHRPDAFNLHRARFENRPHVHRVIENQTSAERRAEGATIQLSFRRQRPPRAIHLRTDQIVFCAGPWRSSGDWWASGNRGNGWAREEWDIELSNGGLYRIYWDCVEKKWFLDGVYD
jgi:protein ImuB